MTINDDCGGSDDGGGTKEKEEKGEMVSIYTKTNNVSGQMQNFEQSIQYFYIYV